MNNDAMKLSDYSSSLLYFAPGEFCGWAGHLRRKTAMVNSQFVGQMDRPSTSLNSIRSEIAKAISACVIRGQAMGRTCPSQTPLIKLLGGFL